jgi:hypothetical protein
MKFLGNRISRFGFLKVLCNLVFEVSGYLYSRFRFLRFLGIKVSGFKRV